MLSCIASKPCALFTTISFLFLIQWTFRTGKHRSVVDRLKPATNGRPKAVIYYLSRSLRMDQLVSSIIALEANFNLRYRYPVIVFYEEDDRAFNETQILQAAAQTDVRFQRIRFEMPPFINQSALPKRGCATSFPLGYRHMCRFQAFGIYEHPVLRDYEYALRLDDDSLLLEPVGYDIFERMKRDGLQYGYIFKSNDQPACLTGLWKAVDAYARNESIRTDFFAKWPKNRIFYNNFELSALSLWRSAAYRKYANYIDRLAGIYFYRWGDAPIKTLAVTLFVPRNQTRRFRDIVYRHHWYSQLRQNSSDVELRRLSLRSARKIFGYRQHADNYLQLHQNYSNGEQLRRSNLSKLLTLKRTVFK